MKTLGFCLTLLAFLAYPLESEARRCRDGVCRDRGAVRPVRPGRPPARVNPTRPRPPRVRPAPSRPRNPRAGRDHDRDRRPDRGWHRDNDRRRDYDFNRPPRQRRDRVRHRPVRIDRRPRVVYRNPYQYYRGHNRSIDLYRNRWLRWSISFNDGLHYLDGRPFYVYNGYRHRYTPVEICDYELVDRFSHTTHRTFYGLSCSTGYDRCADLRDDLNWYEYDDRYFCAERYFNDPYRY